jgi:ankyrin repeat protein
LTHVRLVGRQVSLPLHQAAEWNRDTIALKLIPLMSLDNINFMSYTGWTGINLASSRNRVAVIKALGQAGADPSLTKFPIPSALHHAAQWGFTEAAECLLEMGAPPDQRSGEEMDTALHAAVRISSLAIAENLLDHGASSLVHNKIGLTPFHAACFRGDIAFLELFLRGYSEEEKRAIVREPQGRVPTDLEFDETLTPIAMAPTVEVRCRTKRCISMGT